MKTETISVFSLKSVSPFREDVYRSQQLRTEKPERRTAEWELLG